MDKQLVRYYLFTVALSAFVYAAEGAVPSVSSVSAIQRPGTRYVDITYNLSDSDSATLSVSMQISTNGGTTYFTPSNVTGDLGSSVARGNNRKIVWDAGATLPAKLFANVKARVTADDSPAPSGMVLIPAGSFVMGACTNVGQESFSGETPQHTVYVSAFYIDQYEVTKAMWDDVATWASSHGYDISAASGSGKAVNHPVYYVSWYECVKWCNARSAKDGLTPCYTVGGSTYTTGISDPDCNWSANGYRLPTEAEWEKAARGGVADHRFPWSGTDTIRHMRSNYYSNTNWLYDTSPTHGYHPTFNDGVYPFTSPVGYFAANGYGIYDMAGNLTEWCWDRYASNYYGESAVVDPRGPASGPNRVLRSGSWGDGTPAQRNARRLGVYDPSSERSDHGFRCARGM